MFCLFGGKKLTFIENSFLASIWGSIVPYPLHHVVDSVKMTFTLSLTQPILQSRIHYEFSILS